MVDFFHKAWFEDLTFEDLIAQHNEHRMLFPKLIFLALASISSWNIRLELFFSWALAVFTFIALCKIADYPSNLLQKKSTGQSKDAFYSVGWAEVLSSIFVFSLVQIQNWIWGFQIAWFLINFSVVLAILTMTLFQRTGKIFYFVIASMACIMGSFSSAHGILSWISASPILLLSSRFKVRKRFFYACIWLSLFVTCTLSYLADYQRPASHPEANYVLLKPFVALDYYFNFLGGVFGNTPTPPLVLGVIVFLLAIALTIHSLRLTADQRDSYLPWLSLGIFALLFALMTTVGRAGFGSHQALISRYTTVTSLLLVSLAQILRLKIVTQDNLFSRQKTRMIFTYMLSGLLFSHVLVGYKHAFASGEHFQYSRYRGMACTKLLDYLEPSLLKECVERDVFPSAEVVISRRAKLKEMNFNQFQEDDVINFNDVQSGSVSYGHIDTPPSQSQNFLDGENIIFSGWAHDPTCTQACKKPKFVLLRLQDANKFFAIADVGSVREDVASAFNNDEYRKSGWSVIVPTDLFPEKPTKVSGYLYSPEKNELFKLHEELELIK
ncbi:MAG: hypothetical protein AAFW84_22745 [Cyanobacteria bacterium J06635_15]